MKLLITGICGFVGNALARELKRRVENLDILGVDNLSRPGSEQNRLALAQENVRFFHGDVRTWSDLDSLPKVDWVIDAAANPSVIAGISGQTSSRQLLEHNLVGTINLLEFCKRQQAGFILLSTSRVYSLAQLANLPVVVKESAFVPRFEEIHAPGLSSSGVAESFSTQAPVSLYGSAKLASEILALEYGAGFDLPVHVNRCGVMAGAGQFGKADQGIFTFWIHSYRYKRPLKYLGFGGKGYQVRDCLHPRDLSSLVAQQLRHPTKSGQILNVSGGAQSSLSLAQLSQWCASRFAHREVEAEPALRRYDVPWLVLDSTRAKQEWNWEPTTNIETILEEIANHADRHPEWLDISSDA
jgi:CDP-paratose 2-epimerase